VTLRSTETSGNSSLAVLSASDGGEVVPARTVYPDFGGQSTTHVAIRSTPLDDLYVVLAQVDGDSATVLVFDNPLVSWIWAGAALLLLGTLAAAWPAAPGRRPEPARARIGAPVLAGGAE
jgi:cytochrome c-type biogenesis protein CcmF